MLSGKNCPARVTHDAVRPLGSAGDRNADEAERWRFGAHGVHDELNVLVEVDAQLLGAQ